MWENTVYVNHTHIYANLHANQPKATKYLLSQVSNKNCCNSSQPSQSLHTMMNFPSLSLPWTGGGHQEHSTPDARYLLHPSTNNRQRKATFWNILQISTIISCVTHGILSSWFLWGGEARAVHDPVFRRTNKGLRWRKSGDLEDTVPFYTLTNNLFPLRSPSVLISFQWLRLKLFSYHLENHTSWQWT